EMERRGMKIPLLIGGATTSKQHTALKIAKQYSAPTFYVTDASRVSGIVTNLLDTEKKDEILQENRRRQQEIRAGFNQSRPKNQMSLTEARANKAQIIWRQEEIAQVPFTGSKKLPDMPLAEIAEYIDWTFLFSAWELKGRFPKILDHPDYGRQARDLYENAQALLKRIIDRQLLVIAGVYGFWPAAGDSEDIILFADNARKTELLRFNMLRQQTLRPDAQPNYSLADFITPVNSKLDDFIGAFAVTAGIGVKELVYRFKKDNDDYNAIMTKALADRLADAAAEFLHRRVRRECGFGDDENLSREELPAEKYRGIRPAFGYPACPDHSEKEKLFELLDAPAIGMTLTETFAMQPPASVSGLFLNHPRARYFHIGKIGPDQVDDYAARKGISLPQARQYLAPNLAPSGGK
ncbi:vitamin B12 dependent-methionine synthase activation domain-containing protein, partial [Planctomycetota bacterium]